MTKYLLSDVAAVESGAGFPVVHQGIQDAAFPFLKVSDMNLSGNERAINRWNHSVSEQVRGKLRAKAFPGGSLIFPKVGAAIATNKKRQLTRPSCVDNNVMAILPKPELLDPDFLYYLFLTKNLSDFASDSNPPSIRKSDVEKWKVRVPPLPEQRRIIDLLSRAEGIVRLRREAEKKAAELIPALFLDMFGDPGRNPKGWPVVRLGDLAEKMSDGPFGSNLKTSHYVEAGVRVIRLQNIGIGELINDAKAYVSPEHFASLPRHRCLPDDVIIGTLGDPNLRAFVMPSTIPEALNKADCVQFRCRQGVVSPSYICWLMNMPSMLAMAASLVQGITLTRISMGRLREMIVPVPSFDVQQVFADRVEMMNSIKSQQSSATAKAKTTFNALLAQAFEAHKPAYDENEFQQMVKRGTAAWSDVPNATQWLEELRDGTQ